MKAILVITLLLMYSCLIIPSALIAQPLTLPEATSVKFNSTLNFSAEEGNVLPQDPGSGGGGQGVI